MKKLNRKGFTLIELLAVITIMGILMLVAIPAVSRTIENTRRDTFASTAKSYINALKQSIAADEVEVELPVSNKSQLISSAPSGCYYYSFRTDKGDSAVDLMEQGGKSAWGNADTAGYIALIKTMEGEDTEGGENPTPTSEPTPTTEPSDDDSTDEPTGTATKQKTKYEYAILIVDTGNHGTTKLTVERNLKRSEIYTKTELSAKPESDKPKTIAIMKPKGEDWDKFGSYTITASENDSTVLNEGIFTCLELNIA